MGFGDTWDLGVGDIFNGISTSSVFRQSRVVVIDETSVGIKDDVFENRTETDGVEDFRFLLS